MAGIGGVLLAAGMSVRMGRPKLLETIGGVTLLEMAVANHLSSRLAVVGVVVPGWDERFEPVLKKVSSPGLEVVKVDAPCQMSQSLKVGWQRLAARSQVEAIAISLADKPLIGPRIINHLIDCYLTRSSGICVPIHNGRRGHPVIVSLDFSSDIMELEGDAGARSLIERNRSAVVEIVVEDDSIVFDVDDEGDFVKLSERLKHGRG